MKEVGNGINSQSRFVVSHLNQTQILSFNAEGFSGFQFNVETSPRGVEVQNSARLAVVMGAFFQAIE